MSLFIISCSVPLSGCFLDERIGPNNSLALQLAHRLIGNAL